MVLSKLEDERRVGINKLMFLKLDSVMPQLFSLTPLRIFLTLNYTVIPGSGRGRALEEIESAHVSEKLNPSYVSVRMLEVGKAISGHLLFLQGKFGEVW